MLRKNYNEDLVKLDNLEKTYQNNDKNGHKWNRK